MKTIQLGVKTRNMFRPRRSPVVEAGLKSDAVCETVRDREPSASLELGEDDDHLSVERRHAVNGLQLGPGRHNVVRLLTITPDLNKIKYL